MSSRAPDLVDVTIRVHKDHGDRMDEIVRALEAAGLTSIERHDRFLVVNGSANPEGLEELRRIEGVASLRQDRTYRTQA